jgi:hypothetical protein
MVNTPGLVPYKAAGKATFFSHCQSQKWKSSSWSSDGGVYVPFRIMRHLGFACLLFAATAALRAEPITVRYAQGSSHGFLALRTLDGKMIATGESTQTVRGDQVTSKLVFRFRDGSIDEDETVFTQRRAFRLVSDHHIQHGPSFPKPIDFLIDMASGNLTFRQEDGTVSKEHMDLPDDLSNGLPPNLIINLLPTTPETKISYVAPGKKPRLVHILIRPAGTMPFSAGSFHGKATDFDLHVELGGVVGVVAPILGKEPADYHIWLQSGRPPAFVREEGPLYEGGPIWRIEQLAPSLQ